MCTRGKISNQSKAPGQKPPDNKPPRIIEKIIANNAVDANLFRLGSTNPKEKIKPLVFLLDFCFGFYTRGLLSGGFYPGDFCPGGF